MNTAMQLTVTGKHIDTNAALRPDVEESLDAILDKYFKTAIEAHVVFSKEAHLSRADVSIHVGRGIGVSVALETYPAFDAAAERIAKQMCRYKRCLQNHHVHAREAFESGDYVPAPFDSVEGRGEGPRSLPR
jgi:ribosomal subunit interface protein